MPRVSHPTSRGAFHAPYNQSNDQDLPDLLVHNLDATNATRRRSFIAPRLFSNRARNTKTKGSKGKNKDVGEPQETQEDLGIFDFDPVEDPVDLVSDWEVKCTRPTKRKKSSSKKRELNSQFQSSPFEKSSIGDVLYQIKQYDHWVKYRNIQEFSKDRQKFKVYDDVYIWPTGEIDGLPVDRWLGRILEIREADSKHKFVRIFWFYSPDHLAHGRKPYHGDNELIASNHMDIIDAGSIDAIAKVIPWDEDTYEATGPKEEQDWYYWRQTLDNTTGRLSNLPKYCKDRQPRHPDIPLVQCDSCDGWLHTTCLEDQAARSACDLFGYPYDPEDCFFSAELNMGDSVTIKITHRNGQYQETKTPICLLCGDHVERGLHVGEHTLKEAESREPESVAGSSNQVC